MQVKQTSIYKKVPFNVRTSYAFIILPCAIFYNTSINIDGESRKSVVSNRMDTMFDAILNTKAFNFEKDDFRHLSLAYGDVDINKVWLQYYLNKTVFAIDRLKDVKFIYDPIDMFHTQFTIPLPHAKAN